MSSLYLNYFGHAACDGKMSMKDFVIERAKQFGFMNEFRDEKVENIPHERKPELSKFSQEDYLEKLAWLEYLKTLGEGDFNEEKELYRQKRYDDREKELQQYKSNIYALRGKLCNWMPKKNSIANTVRDAVFEELDKADEAVEEALTKEKLCEYANFYTDCKYKRSLKDSIQTFEEDVKEAEKKLTVSADDLERIRKFNEFFKELDAFGGW